jgi:hypothetical protein
MISQMEKSPILGKKIHYVKQFSKFEHFFSQISCVLMDRQPCWDPDTKDRKRRKAEKFL